MNNNGIGSRPPGYDKREKIPELMTFVKKSGVKNECKYYECYMLINGKKIEKRMPLETTLADPAVYHNGIVLMFKDTTIIFITYTAYNGKCVFNHESHHNKNGDLLMATVNLFSCGRISGADNVTADYIRSMLITYNEQIEKGEFKWDVVE